jgi:hypothetical protein
MYEVMWQSANWKWALSQSAFTFEVLYRAFMFFCRYARAERAQVSSLAGLGINFARIESVLSGLQLSDHGDLPPGT